MLLKFKLWIEKYPAPFAIFLLCFLGIINFSFLIFDYKTTAVFYFVAIAIVYGIFHINGFWNKIKAGLRRLKAWAIINLKEPT